MPQYANERAATANLQRYLRQLSYHQPITPPPIDGIYYSDTEQAIRDFQSIYGLPTTGKADLETWDILYAAYRASLSANSPPRAVLLFPHNENGFAFRMGSNGFSVAALQYMLLELSTLSSELEGVESNGTYDQTTERAVRDFQKRNGFSVNGAVDLGTWNAITDQYNLLFVSGE